MKRRLFRTIFLLGLVLALAGLGTGCATTPDTENRSSRPWNAPRSWQHGVPGMMPSQGRY